MLEVIETQTDIHSPEGGIMEVPSGGLEFRDVRFRYPGNQGDTLEGINFKIKAGESVGVIGSTGSAKTSVIL